MGVNTYTELNCGSGGSIMDEVGIDYGDVTPLPDQCASLPPGTSVLRRRAKVIISGPNLNEVTSVINSNQVGNEYAITVRPVDRAYDQSIYHYDDVASVSPDDGTDTYTTVASYTIPASKTFAFTGVVVGGAIGGKFKVSINGSTKFILRTANTNPTNSLSFKTPPFELVDGDILEVSVIYYNDNSGLLASFEATILGFIF